jgi:hypothetical protein
VELLGLHVKAIWTQQDIADLRESLRVDNPEKEVNYIESVDIVPGIEVFTETDIRRCVQDLLDILPHHIAETLPKIKISLVDTPIGRSGDANGFYRPWELTLRVTTANFTYLEGEWYHLYAGRCYSAETEAAYGGRGLELPPMYYELWEDPEALSSIMDIEFCHKNIANRETFYIVHQLFDNP